jgi:protein SCO1/2
MRRRTRTAAMLLVALSLVGLAAPTYQARAEEALKAGVFEPARMAPDFTLRGPGGTDVTLSRYRGKVVVVVFGFTSCPAVCPTTLSTLAKAHQQLGANADAFQVVYITVDPERDSAEHMKEYLQHFDASFVGATGTDEQLAAVRKEYGIFANKLAAGDSYSFNHSSYTYLVDREGSLRALMPYGQQPEAYVHDVRILLGKPPAETSAPADQAKP